MRHTVFGAQHPPFLQKIDRTHAIKTLTTSATMSTQVETLLAQIKDQGHAFRNQEPGARRKLLDAAVSLIAELEMPVETITRIAWAEV